jgi:RimJ/RimL family protein N-acetyltransferase
MNSDRVTLASRRARLEREGLLALNEPRDALAAYYALYHDAARTHLWLHYDAKERITGFVAVCQTGFNLFQPTVVLRARDDEAAATLLDDALFPGRPYYIVTTPTLSPVVRAAVQLEQEEFNRVYLFDPRRYRPEINVLVQPARAADGSPRFVIRSRDQVASEAGVNWRSPYFAELFVRTEPWAQGRGWGKAVVAACANTLLQAGIQPLYMVSEGNDASIRLAESVGFADTGAREFAGSGVLLKSGRGHSHRAADGVQV